MNTTQERHSHADDGAAAAKETVTPAVNRHRPLAVVFGAGPVGTSAAARFLERGIAVRLVTRSGSVPVRLAGRVEAVSADAMKREEALRAASGARYVVHCLNPSYEQWGAVLPPVQRNLIDAAVENNAVFAASENLYMYSPPSGPIREDSAAEPKTRKGAIRAELHAMLHRARTDRGLVWVTVRASDYYGPGATWQSHFGDRFLGPLFKGRSPRIFGSPDQPHSVAYVDDFGFAVADAALDPTAHNRTWIAPHDRALTTRAFAQMFFDQTGRRGDVKPYRRWFVTFVGLVLPVVRELREMLYQFERPFTVDDSAYRAHFKTLPVPLEEGVRRTIEEYRRRSGDAPKNTAAATQGASRAAGGGAPSPR